MSIVWLPFRVLTYKSKLTITCKCEHDSERTWIRLVWWFATADATLNLVDISVELPCCDSARSVARELRTANNEFAYTPGMSIVTQAMVENKCPTFSNDEIDGKWVKRVWEYAEHDRLNDGHSPGQKEIREVLIYKEKTHDVRIHLLMANIISLLMMLFVSLNDDRLLSRSTHRATAIKISDRIANVPNGTTQLNWRTEWALEYSKVRDFWPILPSVDQMLFS